MLKNIIHSKIVKPFQSMRVTGWWSWSPGLSHKRRLGVFGMKTEFLSWPDQQYFDLLRPRVVFTLFGRATRYFISCMYVEQWVIQGSRPVVSFIPAKTSDHDDGRLTPWHLFLDHSEDSLVAWCHDRMAFESQKKNQEQVTWKKKKECCYYCTITDSQLIVPSETEHVGSYLSFLLQSELVVSFLTETVRESSRCPNFLLH